MKESAYREILDPTTEQLEIRSRFSGPTITRRAPIGRRFATVFQRAGAISMFDLIVATFPSEAEARADYEKKMRKANFLGYSAGEICPVERATITCPCCDGLGSIPKIHHLYRMPPQRCPVCLIGRVDTTTPADVDKAFTKWRRATGYEISHKDRRRCVPHTWFGRTWDYAAEAVARIAAPAAPAPSIEAAADRALAYRADCVAQQRAKAEFGLAWNNGRRRTVPQQQRLDQLQAQERAKRLPEIRRRAGKDLRRQILIIEEVQP